MWEFDERVPRLLDDDRTEQTEKGIAVDLAAWGVGKLLGAGRVTRALIVTVDAWSHGAAQKIEHAGGEIRTPT
jgi:ribosomal protein L15